MATVTMSSNNPFLKDKTGAAPDPVRHDSTQTQSASKDDAAPAAVNNESSLASRSDAVRSDLQSTDSFTLDENFHPTHCLYIPRHWGTTQRIPIYDITSSVDLTSYPQADNKAIGPWFTKANTIGLEHANRKNGESYAIHRENWYGNNFTLRLPPPVSSNSNDNDNKDGGDLVVDWKGGWYSGRRNRLLFPAGSPHSSHEITMKSDNYIKFREVFVVNSCRYEWHCLNRLSMRQFRCDMVLGGGSGGSSSVQKTVARMWKPPKDWLAQGGVLVLEASREQSGLDEVVLLSTAMVVLRKTRQKAYEYSN